MRVWGGVACALVLAFVLALGIEAWRVMGEPGMSSGDAAQLDGVWRSQGYGWLWAIEDGRARVYDESGTLCLARHDQPRKLKRLARDFELSADGRVLRLSTDDPAYRFTFDRIATLPEGCARTPDASPLAVIDAVEKIFSAHYAFFAVRRIEWPALVAAARREVGAETSEEELLQVARCLLANFDDDHVSLRARIKGRKVVCNTGEGKALRGLAEKARRKGVELNDMIERWKRKLWSSDLEDELFDDTLVTTANGNVKYGLIDGEIGYLGVQAMDDFSRGDDDLGALERALDDAMALFEGAKAVIVDVSSNDGGEDVLARAVAARFADKRTLAYSKYAGDAPGADPQAIYVEPAAGRRYRGPVYLLTSNVTVSAAEIFTLAMRALPNVTHAGQTTRGSLSDMLGKRLPNGWSVTLSNEVYLDADGKGWEGAGIPPSLAIPVFTGDDDPAASHTRALRALVARIDSAHM
jgi:carboxyl-terminal processing protease